MPFVGSGGDHPWKGDNPKHNPGVLIFWDHATSIKSWESSWDVKFSPRHFLAKKNPWSHFHGVSVRFSWFFSGHHGNIPRPVTCVPQGGSWTRPRSPPPVPCPPRERCRVGKILTMPQSFQCPKSHWAAKDGAPRGVGFGTQSKMGSA